jgi:hypothetical protein
MIQVIRSIACRRYPPTENPRLRSTPTPKEMLRMFAPSFNFDLSKLAQSEDQAAASKKIASKGARAKARKDASGSDKTAKKS